MSNDLLYSVGVDGNELNTGVAAIEARLAESGVLMAEVPAKYAKASAEAFNETYTAEDKLAKFRADSAFARMSDEEKIAVLRQQALGLLDQIQASEGQSAEKANLQIQFEQKKNAIYDLNTKIQAESLAATKAQTEETSKHPGLLGKVEEGAQSIKKAFHEMGVSLHGAGIGLIFAEVINLGKEAVANAQKQRDEYEKIGKPLTGATKSMATFGDAIDSVKHAAMSAVGYLIGGYTQLGDLIGDAINGLRGITKEQGDAALAGERLADAATARVTTLKEEQHDVENISAARQSLFDAEKKAAAERGSDEKNFQTLLNQNFQLREQIRNTEVGTVAYYEREKALLENGVELNKLALKLIQDKASAELDRVKNTGAMDITYQQKAATLAAEANVLLRERKQLLEQHADLTKVNNQLEANSIAMKKLDADYRAKAALSEEDRIFMFKVENRLLKDMTEQDGVRYQVLKKQAEEKRNQLTIDELMEKKQTEGLTPAEQARLIVLFKQNETLEKQIKILQGIIAGIAGATAGTVANAAAVDAAASAWNKYHVAVTGGADFASMSTAALQGTIDRLNRQLNQVGSDGLTQIRNATINGNYGDWLTASNIRGQLNPAQQELNLRQEVQAYDKRYGDAATTAQYGDAITQRSLAAYTESANKTNTVLETISTQLAKLFPK